MAIIGRSLGEAAARFKDHLNSVLARTITQVPLTLLVVADRSHAMLSFRQDGSPVGVLVKSRFGRLRLWLGQTCGALEDTGGQHRLYTARYRYTISTDDGREPLLRWEYERTRPTPDAVWCRHHLQGAIDLNIGDDAIALNEWHLPTGYVPLEEVIRFCIVDLATPPLSRDWDSVLAESYQRFKTEFTGI